MTTTIEDIKTAIRKTAWDFLADYGTASEKEGQMTISVSDREANECIDAIRKWLPEGATADFSGSSSTDGNGDTTEDIRIEWPTE